ncbi:MAG: hypothetical protein CMK89_16370 [Pseudomonadales bacterium]|nr:hypothetical protein [Pseudomonadales bacterium]RLU02690.1 MAG: hypothetical protein D9N11_07940 [Ketobacter sp.]
MRDSAYSNEAIVFFEDGDVSKEMTYSEFEAILDGVVGMDDFAGDTIKAAFVVVNSKLKVSAAVLFKIGFDRQGYADRSWNLPLRHLADNAGSGPDMGAGAIRLACKSQCPVAWHSSALWDPDMSPKSNTFVRIRDAIAANKLCLPTYSDPEPPIVQTQVQKTPPNWGMPSAPRAPAPPQWGQGGDSIDYGWDGDDSGLTDSQLAALEQEHRNKIAALIKQQRLHIQTLKNEAQQTLQTTRVSLEKELELSRQEVARLRSEHESLHAQNIALREQNEAQRKQMETIKRTRELEMQSAQQSEKAEVEALRKQYEQQLQQRIQEETAKLKEDIELRNMELMYRHDVAKQLREELTQLRKDKIRLVHEGGDKFLERLEALGVSFIAFHPGAGHVSILLSEMPSYMENPIAYAANKCLVSEEHYRTWLDHYQKPECQAPLTNEKKCGCRIGRVDVPSQFIVGDSDRCEKHKPRSYGDNVVTFRG